MKEKILREIKIFDSNSDADAYDQSETKKLSGEERLNNALRLMAPYYEHTPRLERLYRVVELKELPISDGWRVGL